MIKYSGSFEIMRTLSGKKISNICIGTKGIDINNLDTELAVLLYYFNQGINMINVVLAYDNGNTMKVVAEFLKYINREDIFINAFITYGCQDVEDIEKQIDMYMNVLGTDYLDCVTLHSPAIVGVKFDDYVEQINKLRKTNKFFHIGYSNLSPKQFDEVKNNIEYYEGLYNLDCKINEDNGIMGSCLVNGIPFYAYQTLRQNKIARAHYKEVELLARKHEKTPNQILLNWMFKHKKINAVIKSSNTEHIAENLRALNFEMTLEDYKMLDKFRNEFYDSLPVTYGNLKTKIRIDKLAEQEKKKKQSK